MQHSSSDDLLSYRRDLENLQSEREEHRTIIVEHEAKIAELDRLIVAAELLLAWKTNAPLPLSGLQAPLPVEIPRPASKQQMSSSTVPRARWATRLHGLNQFQALVRIAEEHNGVLRVTDARDIFVQVGLARGKPRNVPGHIHHMLRNSDLFEYVEPGMFRLVESEARTPASQPHPAGTDFSRL